MASTHTESSEQVNPSHPIWAVRIPFGGGRGKRPQEMTLGEMLELRKWSEARRFYFQELADDWPLGDARIRQEHRQHIVRLKALLIETLKLSEKGGEVVASQEELKDQIKLGEGLEKGVRKSYDRSIPTDYKKAVFDLEFRLVSLGHGISPPMSQNNYCEAIARFAVACLELPHLCDYPLHYKRDETAECIRRLLNKNPDRPGAQYLRTLKSVLPLK